MESAGYLTGAATVERIMIATFREFFRDLRAVATAPDGFIGRAFYKRPSAADSFSQPFNIFQKLCIYYECECIARIGYDIRRQH
jgi:hypothetical protein